MERFVIGIDPGTQARGIEIAHRILAAGKISKKCAQRYASFDSGNGSRFESGEHNFNDLFKLACHNPEPESISGKQGWYENTLNQYILTSN